MELPSEDHRLIFASSFSREPIAQLVEQRPFKAWVEGSNPSWLTREPLPGLPFVLLPSFSSGPPLHPPWSALRDPPPFVRVASSSWPPSSFPPITPRFVRASFRAGKAVDPSPAVRLPADKTSSLPRQNPPSSWSGARPPRYIETILQPGGFVATSSRVFCPVQRHDNGL